MKLCETADVTSNLGSDLELLESIECEFLTSEVKSKTELGIQKGSEVQDCRKLIQSLKERGIQQNCAVLLFFCYSMKCK